MSQRSLKLRRRRRQYEQVTEWFEPVQVPVRPGVYQWKLAGDKIAYCYFSGAQWHAVYDTRRDAGLMGSYGTPQVPCLGWRGMDFPTYLLYRVSAAYVAELCKVEQEHGFMDHTLVNRYPLRFDK